MHTLGLKLSHHRHSGRLRPHEYTSYGPLALLLIVVGLALTVCSVSALTHPAPQSGSVGLSGTMPGKPPTTAAVITSPGSQQHFSASPVTITGTCPAGTLAEIFKNDIFAGSSVCTDKGTFSFDIDLLIGENTLVARVYDSLNQPGPDSKRVVIYYDAVPAQADPLAPLSFGGGQLLLNTDAVFRGAFPDHDMVVPLTIVGGTAPYAVNMQWGDGSNKVVPRGDNQTFNTAHTYRKAGVYQLTFQATDATGRVAFLTVAAIINGQPGIVNAAATTPSTTNKLLLLWPLYTSALAVVIAFWLGERREKHLLTSPRYLAAHPQSS